MASPMLSERSPFMPVRKRSTTPPTSPAQSSGSAPSGAWSRGHSTTSSFSTHSGSLPSFSVSEASPTDQRPPFRKVKAYETPVRVRSKLSPITPRAAPTALGLSSEWSSSAAPSTSKMPIGGPVRRVVTTGGHSHSDNSSPSNAFDMHALGTGLAGLGLGLAADEESHRTPRKSKRDNVLVTIRVRPPAAKLAASSVACVDEAWDVDAEAAIVSLKDRKGVEYSYDSVVTGTDNREVYEHAGRDLVLAALDGYDAVIFAYGQTASGKTFTVSGTASNPGIIPQAISEIFQFIRSHPEKEFLLRASYLEIYNETLKDLLQPDNRPVIRLGTDKQFCVKPLQEEVVTGEAHVAELLLRGNANRSTGRTDFNDTSSRSHSVFQLIIESRTSSESSVQSSVMSRLTLIDLAGSEVAVSDASRRAEGAFINKSLLTLEKVISSLTSGKDGHVPYRESQLTRILQPSLSGAALVSVIATINPSPMAVEETKSTLKFAQRIKKVVLKAVVREVVDDKMLIHKYRSHIAMLEAKLAEASSTVSVPSTPRSVDEDSTRATRHESQRQMKLMREEVASLQDLFLTSSNISNPESNRRRSLLPPRPVSPMKLRPTDAADEDSIMEDKYQETLELLSDSQDQLAQLLLRITELQDENLLLKQATSSSAEPSDIIAGLLKENRELHVINRNLDPTVELKVRETAWERRLEKTRQIQQSLSDSLDEERSKNKKFERFIIQHLSSRADVISQSHRSSIGRNVSFGGHKGDGFIEPLFLESLSLAQFDE